jgi:hypothetical protein
MPTFLSAFFGLTLDGDILPPLVPPVTVNAKPESGGLCSNSRPNASKRTTMLLQRANPAENSTQEEESKNDEMKELDESKARAVDANKENGGRKQESMKLEQSILVTCVLY